MNKPSSNTTDIELISNLKRYDRNLKSSPKNRCILRVGSNQLASLSVVFFVMLLICLVMFDMFDMFVISCHFCHFSLFCHFCSITLSFMFHCSVCFVFVPFVFHVCSICFVFVIYFMTGWSIGPPKKKPIGWTAVKLQ